MTWWRACAHPEYVHHGGVNEAVPFMVRALRGFVVTGTPARWAIEEVLLCGC